jgi:hypothetical protein
MRRKERGGRRELGIGRRKGGRRKLGLWLGKSKGGTTAEGFRREKVVRRGEDEEVGGNEDEG